MVAGLQEVGAKRWGANVKPKTAQFRNLPADLAAADVLAIVDTREQLPFDVAPLRMVTGTLATGDYSIVGLEDRITVERKSLSDLIGCCGVERERFQREVERLRSYETRCVIVEASWDDLEAGDWKSKIGAQAVVGSVLGWVASGVPFVMAGDRERAQGYCAKILYLAARRYYRIARTFVASMAEGPGGGE